MRATLFFASLAAASALAPSAPTAPTLLSRRAWAAGSSAAALMGISRPARAAEPTFEKTPSGLEFMDVRLGDVDPIDDRLGIKVISDSTKVIVDYKIWTGGFDETLIESSAARNRMPLLFTIGTGAVNRAVDEMVRDMRQGGVRRFRIPAKFDATSLLRDELYVQIRLRDIKGPSRGGAICAVPPNGRVGPSILCQPGAAVMLV